jgi:hypothetical protein
MNITPEASKQAERHLNTAERLSKNHDFSHMEGHEDHLKTYINQTVRTGETPTSEGYVAHLMKRRDKSVEEKKSEAGKQKAKDTHNAMIGHVRENKKHFDTTLEIHHHVEKAKDLLTTAINSSAKHEFSHTINGKQTNPEGYVATVNNRPIKLVHREEFSRANFAKVREQKEVATQSLNENYDYKLGPTTYDLGMKIRGAFAYHPSVYKYLTDEQIDNLDEHDKVLFARAIKQRNVVDE